MKVYLRGRSASCMCDHAETSCTLNLPSHSIQTLSHLVPPLTVLTYRYRHCTLNVLSPPVTAYRHWAIWSPTDGVDIQIQTLHTDCIISPSHSIQTLSHLVLPLTVLTYRYRHCTLTVSSPPVTAYRHRAI